MADTNPTRRPELVAARVRRGMTQEQAAEKLWVVRGTVARWEQGRQAVRPFHRARIAEVFGVSAEEVERWVDGAGQDPRPDRETLCLSYEPSLPVTLESVAQLWRWDVDPNRRRFLVSLPFVPAALSATLSAWRFDAPDTTLSGNTSTPNVGHADIQRLRDDLQAFDQMDRQYGGGLVRPAIAAYLDERVKPLLHGSYTDEVGRALFSAASSLTCKAGYMAFDEHKHGLAQRYYTQALRMAKAGGESLTAAEVLEKMSKQAHDLKRPEWAVRLARAARDAGRDADAPPHVRCLLVLREARALTLRVSLGDAYDRHTATQAEQVVAEAERILESARDTGSDSGWSLRFTPAILDGEAGACWQLLGRYDKAAQSAQQTLDGLGAGFERSRLLTTMHLAEARLGQGELDGALDAAREAVPAARTLSSPRATSRLRDLPLDRYAGEPRVREFHDHLRAELPATV